VGSVSGAGMIWLSALGSSGSLILSASDTAAIGFEGIYADGVPYAFESLELQSSLRIGTILGSSPAIPSSLTTRHRGDLRADHEHAGDADTDRWGLDGGHTDVRRKFRDSLFQVMSLPQTGVATIRERDQRRRHDRRQHEWPRLQLDRCQRGKLDHCRELGRYDHRHPVGLGTG